MMDLKVLRTNKVTIDDMEAIQYLSEFSFPNRVYRAYKGMTRNNDFITYEQARKKLIRNIMLSYEAPVKEGLQHKRTMYYGCLLIQLNLEEKSICYVNNSVDKHYHFKMDKERRKALNYIIGIND